jgi:nucleoside-diphosphate-sugar epimerase
MSQRVFITGATGFVGSRLASRLVEQNFDVHISVRPTSNLWRIKNFQDKLSAHDVNLLDQTKIHCLLKNINPDYVFHLACYGGFPDENEHLNILNTNIIATFNLLEACAQTKTKKFIYIGSSSEYGFQSEAMTEECREMPRNIYGVSKLAASHLTRLYAEEEILSTTILRIFSPYGQYDAHKRLIPNVIRACIEKKSIQLGSGKQVRDFIYVEDLIDAFLGSLDKTEGKGEIINLGSGLQHTVSEVVHQILEICGHPVKCHWNALTDRKNEPSQWVANITKAVKILNWEPHTDLRTGLAATIDWAKQRWKNNESF